MVYPNVEYCCHSTSAACMLSFGTIYFEGSVLQKEWDGGMWVGVTLCVTVYMVAVAAGCRNALGGTRLAILFLHYSCK